MLVRAGQAKGTFSPCLLVDIDDWRIPSQTVYPTGNGLSKGPGVGTETVRFQANSTVLILLDSPLIADCNMDAGKSTEMQK